LCDYERMIARVRHGAKQCKQRSRARASEQRPTSIAASRIWAFACAKPQAATMGLVTYDRNTYRL